MTIAFSSLTRRALAVAGSICLAVAFTGGASAEVVRSTPEAAQAMVDRAIAHYDAVGEEQAFADFSNASGAFVDGELYVIVCTSDGIYKTHAHNAALIDNDILMDIQDVNGAYPVRRIVQSLADHPEGGWVDYVWVNPANEALENKRVYVAEHAGYAFAVGYYEAN